MEAEAPFAVKSYDSIHVTPLSLRNYTPPHAMISPQSLTGQAIYSYAETHRSQLTPAHSSPLEYDN